jgi:DNA gyrase subunit A
MKVSGISEQGRATQGVKLIRLDEGDEIAVSPGWKWRR